MATEQQRSESESASNPLRERLVIDTDVHLTYNEDLRRRVARRMDMPYRGYTDPDTDGDPYPKPGFPRTLGGRKEFLVSDVSSPETIQEELCEGLGVDHPIVNTIAPVDQIYSTGQALAEMRAVNDVLIEEFLDGYDHFYGLASVATRDPDAAAEEIDRLAGEDRIVGAYLMMGDEYQEKPLGDPRYDAMYAAMEDAGLTPVLHISNFNRKASAIREFDTNFSRHALGPPWSAMYTVTSMIAQGVPEKFPDLDFLVLESGLTSVALLMARLNRGYGEFRAELPLLEKSPEEYIRERFYFATQPLGEFNDPAHLKSVMGLIGTDSIVFSSDYPHHDFDAPMALDSLFGEFSPEERERMFSGNAVDLFDLDL